MKVIALTGRAGSGKDTAALGIRMLTGSLDPTQMMSLEGCPISGPNRHVVDLEEFFNLGWPNHSTNEKNWWKTVKFSQPVYDIAAIITGHKSGEEIMTDEFKKATFNLGGKPKTGREMLQVIGTEFGRTVFDEGIWISCMENKLLQLNTEGYTGVIITDLRFLNEAAFCSGLGATIIKVVGRDSGLSQAHPSESELDQINPDIYLLNHLDYVNLMDRLQEICNNLKISNHIYTWK